VAVTCAAAKRAARALAQCDTSLKDAALAAIARALRQRTPEILRANELDMQAGEREGIGDALLDRLRLDEGRIEGIARAVEDIAALPDPVGELIEGRRLPNGLDLRKVRVPLGVVAVVYEARPNVTVDAAALCLKSGNAVVLRGGSAAKHSNRMLAEVVQGAILEAGLPADVVTFIAGPREALLELVALKGLIDVVIPRGGDELKELLTEHSRVPVIAAAGGNCHVYVDAAADLDMALAITVNAKCQRPGVCNAAETLLVHRAVADAFLPAVVGELSRRGVELVVDRATSEIVPGPPLKRANRTHYETEFLDLKMALRVVESLDEAIDHIATYGSGHSEAIVTADLDAARRFTREVDAAAVYVNASTRFTDGGQFGLGAEMGISTQKLHVRGPISLRELTCLKYIAWGDGQVRA